MENNYLEYPPSVVAFLNAITYSLACPQGVHPARWRAMLKFAANNFPLPF